MINRKSMLTTYLISVILLIPSLHANNLGKYHIQRESTVWIEGSSNINTFKCVSYKVHGEGILDSSIKAAPIIGSPFNVRLKATFAITVKSMDCGNPMVNSDMYEALKSDDFTTLSYELKRVDLLGDISKDDGAFYANTVGILTVAGSPREIKMKVKLTSLGNGKYKIEGNKEVLMTDFGVKPPTAMMGLLKAHDKLTFYFDIIVDG
jgi:hypothetical protein